MKRIVSALALAAMTLAAPAFAANEAVEKVTFTNKVVDGKKTWTPMDAKVHAGKKVEITLTNTLPEPHGFEIKGLVTPVVVNANETKTVTVDAPKAGTYKIDCQLHPAHVAGQMVIQ